MSDATCPEPGCKQTLTPYSGVLHPFKMLTGWCKEHGRKPLPAKTGDTQAEAPVTASGSRVEALVTEVAKGPRDGAAVP